MILGLAALICPLPVHRKIIKVDAPIALVVAILLPFLLLNHILRRVEGFLLITGFVAYTLMNFLLARRQSRAGIGELKDVPLISVSRYWAIDIFQIILGIGILVYGSSLLVDSSVSLAKAFGISEAVIGLTIVAVGTSMPELATSLVAAFRKQPDISVGNIVGSNVFNILGILGFASIVTPLQVSGISVLDYFVMIGFSLLLIPLLYTGRLLHRLEGSALLILYGTYVFMLWPK